MLFSLLDYETDAGLVSDIHDTLTSIVQTMAAENLQSWLALCREVLTDQDVLMAGAGKDDGFGAGGSGEKDLDEEDKEGDVDDDAEFTFGDDPEAARRALMIQPRWTTRVFAAQCLRKIIQGNLHITL